MMSDLVCVGTFPNRMEAEMAQSLLASSGIRGMISADDCGGIRTDMLLGSGGVKLLVLREHAEEAAEVLRELETRPDGAAMMSKRAHHGRKLEIGKEETTKPRHPAGLSLYSHSRTCSDCNCYNMIDI